MKHFRFYVLQKLNTLRRLDNFIQDGKSFLYDIDSSICKPNVIPLRRKMRPHINLSGFFKSGVIAF